MRNSLLLFMGDLPEDVQAMRPKLRDRCLNYALQAARLAGVTDMASVYEMFISYCRALYTGGSLQIEQRFSSFVNGEPQLINNYIVNCLTPRRGQNLRFSNTSLHSSVGVSAMVFERFLPIGVWAEILH